MVTRWIFTGLVALLALQRIYELRLSSKNEAIIRSRGGREHAAWQLPVMKALHAGWFIAMLLEVHILHRPFIPLLSLLAMTTLLRAFRWYKTVSIDTCVTQIMWESFWRYWLCPCFTLLMLRQLSFLWPTCCS